MNELNLMDKIEILADSLTDCILSAQNGKAKLPEYKKFERKFKPRRKAQKRVFCN